jgi:uncharacterized membrane protein YeiH
VPPKIQALVGPLVLVLDLCGTFVFALSGGMTAVRHQLDLFGVLVLSFAAATSGGIIRDVLLGTNPPASLRDWRYIAVSLLAGAFTFYWRAILDRQRSSVLVLDAAGLSLFAVSGALKALAFQLNPLAAVMLGVLTAVGGGVIRDLLVSEVPTILRSELYAVAALSGAGVVVIGSLLKVPSTATTLVGAGLCFTLRLVAIRRGWRLPVADEIRRSHEGARAPVTRPNEGSRGG